MKINYDGRSFRPVQTAGSGEVGPQTIFHYHQSGSVVWAEYSGGEIRMGHLIAICGDSGCLDMRYHHVNISGQLMTGICKSTPEILPEGRIRLIERWQWTSGDLSQGDSVLEEF